MPEFALLNADRTIREYRNVAAQPPNVAGKGWYWLPVVRTSFDATYEAAVAPSEPVSSNATQVTFGKAYLPLADVKAAKLAKLANERWQREVGGYTVNGVTVLTDDRSKLMLTGAYNSALADAGWSTEWKVAPGVFVTLDAATVIGLSNAVSAYVAALFAQEAAHAAAIVALNAAADVVAYDVVADWPPASI